MMKERQISELILRHKLLKERFIERQGIQEKSRKDVKTYENLNKQYTKNKFVQSYIKYLEQIIVEKLNKEQNIRNNKQLEKHDK